jgi:phosphoribosylanthranilate isomerase
MTRVKICGITNAADAAAAAAAGADALGFVFAPASPRRVAPDEAARIVAALPPFVAVVGVFADQPLAEIAETVARCGLHAVQLHGAEPPELARAIAVPVIRALRVRDVASLAPLADYPAQAFLLDAYVPGQAGGTGCTVPWELARQARAAVPIILAGGLTPETVGDAVRCLRPFGVDASSGLEREPGKKDHDRVKEFIAHVRRADLDT